MQFIGKTIEKQSDGSTRLLATYAFGDVNDVKLAPIPFGPGWEDLHLAFAFRADTSLAAEHFLNIRWHTPEGKGRGNVGQPELPPLSQRDEQQVRQLLPVFKDLLAGFELSLRLEVYQRKKWASVTRGHRTNYRNFLSSGGGRLTVFQITDKHLLGSDDGLMLVVPWRQIGRELDLERGNDGHRGPQLLPHVSHYDRGGYSFSWRAIQTPRGREYY